MNNDVFKKLKKLLLFSSLSIGFLIFEVVFLFIGIDFTNMTLKTSIILTFIKYIFKTGLNKW